MSHGIIRDNDLRVLSEDGRSFSTSQSSEGSPRSAVFIEIDESPSPQVSVRSELLEHNDGNTRTRTG